MKSLQYPSNKPDAVGYNGRMQLTVAASGPSPDSIWAKLETGWLAGVTDAVEVVGATVIGTTAANAWLPVGTTWEQVREAAGPVDRWWVNRAVDPGRTAGIIDGLTTAGYLAKAVDLCRWVAEPTSAATGLTVIPARAAYAHVATLAGPAAVGHLDDPLVEGWIGIADGAGVALVLLQVSGETAAIRDWFVSPDHRGRGAGRAVLTRAYSFCRRAGVRVALAAGRADKLRTVGFEPVGTWIEYGR